MKKKVKFLGMVGILTIMFSFPTYAGVPVMERYSSVEVESRLLDTSREESIDLVKKRTERSIFFSSRFKNIK